MKTLFTLIQWIIIITLVAGIGLFWKFERQTTIYADKAVLSSEQYFIGIDYTGVITDQMVSVGDIVKEGDQLVTIKSPTLIERLNESNIAKDDLFYDLNENNEIILKAGRDGVIESIEYTEGSFVAANSKIMTIVDTNYHVDAILSIPKADFYQLSHQNQVLVTIGSQQVSGVLKNFDVTSNQGAVIQVSARIILDSETVIAPHPLGSPVIAEVKLKENPLDPQLLLGYIKRIARTS